MKQGENRSLRRQVALLLSIIMILQIIVPSGAMAVEWLNKDSRPKEETQTVIQTPDKNSETIIEEGIDESQTLKPIKDSAKDLQPPKNADIPETENKEVFSLGVTPIKENQIETVLRTKVNQAFLLVHKSLKIENAAFLSLEDQKNPQMRKEREKLQKREKLPYSLVERNWSKEKQEEKSDYRLVVFTWEEKEQRDKEKEISLKLDFANQIEKDFLIIQEKNPDTQNTLENKVSEKRLYLENTTKENTFTIRQTPLKKEEMKDDLTLQILEKTEETGGEEEGKKPVAIEGTKEETTEQGIEEAKDKIDAKELEDSISNEKGILDLMNPLNQPDPLSMKSLDLFDLLSIDSAENTNLSNVENHFFGEDLIKPTFIPIGPFPGIDTNYEVKNFDYPNKIVWELKVNVTESGKYNKIWHNFTTTEDSGLGQPKITAINQNLVATGGKENEFRTASIQGTLKTGETIYTIETPITKVKSHYLLDYHITVDQGNSKINKAHLRLDARKQITSYTGEYISSSLAYLDIQNNIVNIADSATPTAEQLEKVAIIRNITGEYKDANTVIWRVSDTNVSKPQYDKNTDTYKYPTANSEISFNIDESQEKVSARQWKLKPSDELNDVNVGNKFIKYGESSPNKDAEIFTISNLPYGEIAQYEFITKVREGEGETRDHYFWTDAANKESTKSGLKALKKYFTIYKTWADGAEPYDTRYRVQGLSGEHFPPVITLSKGSGYIKSETPYFVYEETPEGSNGFTSPRKQITRKVEEIDINDGYEIKEFSSNHATATYNFTNGKAGSNLKCSEYGVTEIKPIEINQITEDHNGIQWYGWRGDLSGKMLVQQGMKAGEYYTLTLAKDLVLNAEVSTSKVFFEIKDENSGKILFNVFYTDARELRFVATSYLENAVEDYDLPLTWQIGHPSKMPTNGGKVNNKPVGANYETRGGVGIDKNYAYDYEKWGLWTKTGGINGALKKNMEFSASSSINPDCKKNMSIPSTIHFEDNFDDGIFKFLEKRVIKEETVGKGDNAKIALTYEITSTLGNFKGR